MGQAKMSPPLTARFIERLGNLERGDLAVLRRNAGLSLGESRRAIGLFYRLLPEPIGPREEVYFLVATLYPLNDKPQPGRDFGYSLCRLKARSDSDSLDQRMAILLDSDFEWHDNGRLTGGELGFRLRQAVKLLASKEIGVDWELLLRHLLQWSHPDKWVQKSWARSYYGAIDPGMEIDEGGVNYAD